MLKQLIKKHYLLLGILLVASFFRLFRVHEYMEFLGDQGRDVVIISNFLKHGDLFFIGPQTSIGNMYLGPYFYYLISPALLVANFSPVGPAVFIALLSIATTYLIYAISTKWFNQATGLIAAFLFAISPVVIKYSNFIWNPNVMPFFSLLFIYFISEATINKKYRNLTYASLAFIMAINSHYLALLLLPVGGLLWIYHAYCLIKDKKQLKPLLKATALAVMVFLVSLLPQAIFEVKHHGQNTQALIKFFTYRETTVNIKAYKAIPELYPLLEQVSTRLLTGKNEILGTVAAFLFTLGIGVSLLRAYRTKKVNPFLVINIIWFTVGLVGLALYKQHIYDHYFGFIYPVIFILTAYLINGLYSYKNLLFKVISVIVLVALTSVSLLENPFRYSPNKQLEATQKIAQSIINDANNNPFNLALLAKGNYDPPYKYYLNQKAPLYDLHDKITDQLYVICEPWQMECQPINNPLWEIAAFGWAKVDKQWNEGSIQIFRLVHTQ